MSQGEPARVSVRILEKEYFVTCPYEERAALLDSAEFLNARMREVRDSGKVVGLDRIAVMVALNLTNELLRLRERESMLIAALQRNAEMVARVAQEPLETRANGPALARAGR